MKVDIVMSVNNEELYIVEMLESVQAQTFQNWRLFIRDNASTDNTADIIKKFTTEDNRIFLLEDNRSILPLYLSFQEALKSTSSDYIMFADGDDVWFPQKIKKSLEHIIGIESSSDGRKVPALVFTDLSIVDENLNSISDSMWALERINPARTKLRQLLMQDTGCGNTYIFNRALLDLSLTMKAGCNMHDIWFSLVASCFGSISYLPESTMLYRQHSGNECGSRSFRFKINHYRKNKGLLMERMNIKYDMAENFLNEYSGQLTPTDLQTLNAFIGMRYNSWVKKRYIMFRHGLFMHSWIKNLALSLFLK